MSFQKYEILKEQCSICKSCGTTKEDCLDCEKRKYIKNYEQSITDEERQINGK